MLFMILDVGDKLPTKAQASVLEMRILPQVNEFTKQIRSWMTLLKKMLK